MDYLCYRLNNLPSEITNLELLDAAERASYAQRGEPYLKTRCLLKRELARRLHLPIREIRFTITEHGKPELPGSGLHFNLSHTADLLCLAFHNAPVGIDIQQLRPTSANRRLAGKIMCDRQLAAWQKRGESVAEFFSCWCTAEALVKHAGATIWQALDFPFLYHPTEEIEALFSTAPTIRLFTPQAGFQGAVAYTTLPLPTDDLAVTITGSDL